MHKQFSGIWITNLIYFLLQYIAHTQTHSQPNARAISQLLHKSCELQLIFFFRPTNGGLRHTKLHLALRQRQSAAVFIFIFSFVLFNVSFFQLFGNILLAVRLKITV